MGGVSSRPASPRLLKEASLRKCIPVLYPHILLLSPERKCSALSRMNRQPQSWASSWLLLEPWWNQTKPSETADWNPLSRATQVNSAINRVAVSCPAQPHLSTAVQLWAPFHSRSRPLPGIFPVVDTKRSRHDKPQ